jgi:peroxidase
VNEQVGLTAFHALFLREHNRQADARRARRPGLSDDELYEEARRAVGAICQAITYEEFLPKLLGRDALGPWRGYDPTVDATVRNEFATAGFRLGHTLLSATILRLDRRLDPIPEGSLALRDAFFAADRLITEGGIDPVLRGMWVQRSQALDVLVVDDVRNFLFGSPGAGGLDLPALNLHRGRDHGLASYADTRVAYGLSRPASFADVSGRADVQARLAAAYASVADVDLWVGALAEDRVRGAMVGPLLRAIVGDQFRRARDGDRFWYERVLSRPEADAIRRTRLVDVVRRNTGIRDEVGDDLFLAQDATPPRGGGPGLPPPPAPPR